jgi:UV DNA damage endonuclease
MSKIYLGYACINTTLRKHIFCSRSCIQSTLENKGLVDGIKYVKELALLNIADLLKILEWNIQHGIKFFRITSTLFPHMGNHLLPNEFLKTSYMRGNFDFAHSMLAKIGEYVKKHKIRITFHAQPYVNISSEDPLVFKRSLFDIKVHYKIFEKMGLKPGQQYCLIIHGGGVYGDKSTTIKRIDIRLNKLPIEIRQMLVFENDEFSYNPYDLLPLCEKYKLGFCFDMFHNSVSLDKIIVDKTFIKRVLATWITGVPKMHLSEQAKGERRGAHSEYVKDIPDWVLKLGSLIRLDLMIECKMKELAVLKLFAKYPVLLNLKSNSIDN